MVLLPEKTTSGTEPINYQPSHISAPGCPAQTAHFAAQHLNYPCPNSVTVTEGYKFNGNKGLLAPGYHGIPKSPIHPTLVPGYHGNQGSPVRPTVAPAYHGNPKSPAHPTLVPGYHGNQGSPVHPTVSPGYHGSPKSPDHPTVSPGYHESPKSPVHTAVASGYHGIPKSPVNSTVAPGYHGSPKFSVHPSVAAGYHGNQGFPAHPSAAPGYHGSPKSPVQLHPTVAPGYHGSPKSPVHPAVASGYHEIPKSPIKSTVAPGYHGSPKFPVHPSFATGYHGNQGFPAHPSAAPGYHGSPKSPVQLHPTVAPGYHGSPKSPVQLHPTVAPGYHGGPKSPVQLHPTVAPGYHGSPKSPVHPAVASGYLHGIPKSPVNSTLVPGYHGNQGSPVHDYPTTAPGYNGSPQTSGIPSVAPAQDITISPSYRSCSSALSPSPRSAPSNSRSPSLVSVRLNPNTRFPSPTVSTVPEEPSSPRSGGRATGQDVRNHQSPRVTFGNPAQAPVQSSSPVGYGIAPPIPAFNSGTVPHKPTSPQTYYHPSLYQAKQSFYNYKPASSVLNPGGSPGYTSVPSRQQFSPHFIPDTAFYPASHHGNLGPIYTSRPTAMAGSGSRFSPVGYQTYPNNQGSGVIGSPQNSINHQPSVVYHQSAQNMPHNVGQGPYNYIPGIRTSPIRPIYNSPGDKAPAREWKHLPSDYSSLPQYSPVQHTNNPNPSHYQHCPSRGQRTSGYVVDVPDQATVSSLNTNSITVSRNRSPPHVSPSPRGVSPSSQTRPANHSHGYPTVYPSGPPYCSNCAPQPPVLPLHVYRSNPDLQTSPAPPRPDSRDVRCDSTTTPCPLETYLPDHFKVFPLKQIFGPGGSVLPEYACLCNVSD